MTNKTKLVFATVFISSGLIANHSKFESSPPQPKAIEKPHKTVLPPKIEIKGKSAQKQSESHIGNSDKPQSENRVSNRQKYQHLIDEVMDQIDRAEVPADALVSQEAYEDKLIQDFQNNDGSTTRLAFEKGELEMVDYQLRPDHKVLYAYRRGTRILELAAYWNDGRQISIAFDERGDPWNLSYTTGKESIEAKLTE